MIRKYVEKYNIEGPHETLGYLIPMAAYLGKKARHGTKNYHLRSIGLVDSAAMWTTFQVDPHGFDNKKHVVHTLHSPGDYQR